MKIKNILAITTLVGMGLTAQAVPVTFTFMENGQNQNLGNSSTFTEGAYTITATANSGQSLYSKFAGGGEVGLGLANEPAGLHEIASPNFIQLLAGPGAAILSIFTENNEIQDTAAIYVSTTLGVLGTLLTPTGSLGTFNIPLQYQSGYYIGIASDYPGGDTWVGSVNVGPSVPDTASTVTLLGMGLTCLGLIRRKLSA